MVENELVLQNNFAEMFLWKRTKQFWWPVIFFFAKTLQIISSKSEIKKKFLKSFFSFKISPWTPSRQSWQTSHKNSPNVRKIFSHSRKKKKLISVSFNFFLRKYLVDSRDSDFLTLFEGVFTKNPKLLFVEIRENEAQIPKRSYY